MTVLSVALIIGGVIALATERKGRSTAERDGRIGAE
jgi:hypothetical protein